MQVPYICSDLNFTATCDFLPAVYQKVKSMNFVACWYNFHRCVGLILRVNEPQLEDDVKFICPQPRIAHYYHFVSLS